jgi:hypothetical protein
MLFRERVIQKAKSFLVYVYVFNIMLFRERVKQKAKSFLVMCVGDRL